MEETNIVAWEDYPCGNHARNLHFDAFSRNFAAHVKSTLGPTLEVRTPNTYYQPPFHPNTFPSTGSKGTFRWQDTGGTTGRKFAQKHM
jgi:hypothetical protein